MVGLIEVAAFYLLALSIIWGEQFFKPPVLLLAPIMIALCLASNRIHRDSLERVGLHPKNFGRAMRMSAPWFLPVVILAAVAWGKKAPSGWDFWFSLFGYPVWAFAQDYALLSFIGNRLEDALPTEKLLVAPLNAALFSAVHYPNPILMVATFIGGWVFTSIFMKTRHLVPLALLHAAFGVGISLATSDMYGAMSVGPGYNRRMGEIPQFLYN
jgi:membrane protease YdiL (CAAX protease family)